MRTRGGSGSKTQKFCGAILIRRPHEFLIFAPFLAVRQFKAVSGEGGHLGEGELDGVAAGRAQFSPDICTVLLEKQEM